MRTSSAQSPRDEDKNTDIISIPPLYKYVNNYMVKYYMVLYF